MQLMLREQTYKDTEHQYINFCFVTITKSQWLTVANVCMFMSLQFGCGFGHCRLSLAEPDLPGPGHRQQVFGQFQADSESPFL